VIVKNAVTLSVIKGSPAAGAIPYLLLITPISLELFSIYQKNAILVQERKGTNLL
jgi:hypothetical protein